MTMPDNPKRSRQQQPVFSEAYDLFVGSQSPEWLILRETIKLRDGQMCRVCRAKGSYRVFFEEMKGIYSGAPDEEPVVLDVHHCVYPEWDAPLSAFINQSIDDLLTLCSDCHKAVTTSIRRVRKRRKQSKKKNPRRYRRPGYAL
jgi:hypothetical protein